MLIVQGLAFIGLIFYCIETLRLRKTSENQVKISQDLIDAAMDQVEGLSKPCLTFAGILRDGADAILEMHGATGNITAAQDQGSYMVQNIGNGVALNIRYVFPRQNQNGTLYRHIRYIPNLMPTGRTTLLETLGLYSQDHEVVFEYQSIGGRHYRSTVLLIRNVITSLKFEEVSDRSAL